MGEVTSFEVNGLKVLFKPEEGLEILAGASFFPVGSACERGKWRGATLLSLKSGFKKSALRPLTQFSRLQESMGTGFVPDASSDHSFLRFQAVSDRFLPYFELFVETALNPNFEPDSFSVEKEALLAAIEAKRESAFALGYERFVEITYGGTPYANLPYGTEATVRALTAEDCSSWFKENFFPEGSVFVFVGKFKEFEKVLPLLKELPTRRLPLPTFSAPLREVKREEVFRKGSAQSLIMVGFEAPSVNDPEYPAYKLLNALVGEGVGSLLFQELREKRGFAYAVGSIYPSRKFTGRLLAYVGTSPHKEKEAEEALLRLFRELPDFVTPERVERAKRYFKGTYLLDHESRGKRAWYLGFWESLGKGYGYDAALLEEIEMVSVEELVRVAEKVSQSPYHEVVVKDG
jgi:predicted Zn-dependent peptidase